MAHLTLQLGASVVVPFHAPRGFTAPRRHVKLNTIRLRWRALREAAEAAEGIDALRCATSIPSGHGLDTSIIRSSTSTQKGVSE
jgi:hypothetical protein